MEYQRHLEWDNRGQKLSATSSEGFSDDYGEEEKTYRDRFRSEKTFIKSTPHQTFLKSRSTDTKIDSSPPSSDEQEWVSVFIFSVTVCLNTGIFSNVEIETSR